MSSDERRDAHSGNGGGEKQGRKGDETGRREEVGGSGVYPASAMNAPPDAEVRTPGEWGGGAGGEVGGRSEIIFTEEELRRIKEEEPQDESDT